MRNKDWINIWKSELKEVLATFDVEKFRAFYKKWHDRGYYDIDLPADDRVVEITIRKMVCNLNTMTEEQKEVAKEWLLERGFSTDF